ncbi:uncharacterized protein LOC127079575 [Lathyrus oleraceus]|uniref:uncharacterized protein LOC127079575 n=1 Tax=Pisum sativum TaxID=3888 RepID=UPI0021D3B011|nr:uncharacterized protein LOC127079575 [Pisum sativum]
MKNNGLDILNDVLEENVVVIGVDYNSANKKFKVPPKKKTKFHMYYSHPKSKGKKWKKTQAKKVLKPKKTVKCLLAHVPLRVSSRKDWYFDRGCSHHMTGERIYIEELKPYSNTYVKFCDETRVRIKGIGKLMSSDLPCLDDVLLAEGLTAKLIYIIQLYDQDLNVGYNKSK